MKLREVLRHAINNTRRNTKDIASFTDYAVPARTSHRSKSDITAY